MTRRVFWHIGLLKTGTTYLQSALWAGKNELGDHGVLVPGRHPRRHLLASLDIREDPKLHRRDGDVAHPWQDLVLEADEHDGDVLISHEFFAAAAPHQIQHAVDSFPGAEVHVILTARPMVELGLSLWGEWVRNGGQRSVDAFPPGAEYDPADEWGWGSFDLADVLERWRLAVPEERIHILPMDPEASDPGALLGRFLEVLGLPADAVTPPEERVNESLGVVELETVRRITPHLEGFGAAGQRGRWIRGMMARPETLDSGNERWSAGAAQLADLERRAERARRMLREGEYDLRGELNWLDSPDVSGRRRPDQVEDTELLDVATRLAATLMHELREVTRERNRLRQELDGRRRSLPERARDRVRRILG